MRSWESVSRRPGPPRQAGAAGKVIAAKASCTAGRRPGSSAQEGREVQPRRASGSFGRRSRSGSFGCAATWVIQRLRRDRPEAQQTMGILPHFRRPDHRNLSRLEGFNYR
jgi:hypothetical protein